MFKTNIYCLVRKHLTLNCDFMMSILLMLTDIPLNNSKVLDFAYVLNNKAIKYRIVIKNM